MNNTSYNICHVFCFVLLFPLLDLQGQTSRVTSDSIVQNPPPVAVALPANPNGLSTDGSKVGDSTGIQPVPDATGTALSPNIDQRARVDTLIDADHVSVRAVTQEVVGSIRHLRGAVVIRTSDTLLTADEVDYNEDTGEAEARGHVHLENFLRGEALECDRADYNVTSGTGKFYKVSGTSTPRVRARKGLLTTNNSFYFQGDWAEKLNNHYILHDGFITDCKLPRPWWRLKSSTFLVVPGDHATTRSSLFYVRQVPLFYFPTFYKSLKKEPRKSGFLMPNIGNSGNKGQVVGLGYYWAINRSYDLVFRGQYFTTAGFAEHLELRGNPNDRTTFDVVVNGLKSESDKFPSGALVIAHAKSYLGNGWFARGELDYISSFGFRQTFTQSFSEAVQNQTHSVAYATKHWSDFALNFVAQRNVNYLDQTPGNNISIRKLPEGEFLAREHLFEVRDFPVWFSMDSTVGVLNRTAPDSSTGPFIPRLDLAPHLTTAFHWAGLRLVPTIGVRETYYGASFTSSSFTTFGNVSSEKLLRSSREVSVDLILPSVARIFDTPASLGSFLGQKVKHVIEPRITYTLVSGIDNYSQIARFDETDILSNTNQMQFSLTNRLLSKDKNGTVTDFITWRLWYDRYFDPTFGGAIIPGQRNIVQSELNLTGYAYLDGLRHSSPIVSSFRVQSRVGLEWRTDYDPVQHRFVNSTATVDARYRQFAFFASDTVLKTTSALAPNSNQFWGRVSYGSQNRRGMSYGFDSRYDFSTSLLQYVQAQATYNTDCCGLSFQIYRFDLPSNQSTGWRIAFALSNIGTFGNLRQQDRIF